MTAEVAPLRAGDPQRLGAYRLTGLLGEGGQGTVYLGEGESGGRVAVKLLHARFSGDPKARSRFAAEVAVAKRVSPFCTARVLDSDVEGDRPYIVSEYIEGPALSEVLSADGPRRGADLDRLAIGTMTALAAIHQAGVVHRDFKPANVLLAPDGPRVIDFGIARALDATGTMSSTAVGTPAYMAPEQISGARVGPEADVFSWGATMAYAANGRPAFGQDSIPAVMHRILNLAPDLGDLPEPLRQIVADCLGKDPAVRPASQRVLAHLLDLAGSLPRPGAQPSGPDGAGALMLTQGAATAATESARLHAVQAPLSQAPLFQAPLSQGPQAQAALHLQGTNPPHGPPPAAERPQLPGATWPPPPPPPGRRRRGVGVLASAGGAALVALVVAGTVIAVRIAGDGGSGTDGSPTGRTGGTLALLADDTSYADGLLDPGHSFGGTQQFLTKQLFTGLTELDSKGVARNRLATSITPDKTCETWQIAVREGTTFSNGEPVDAAAFARGWARSAAVSAGPASYLMNDVDGFDAASRSETAGGLSGVKAAGYQLSVKLTSPNCEFPIRLAHPVFAPVPSAAGKSDNTAYNKHPIGNGPFRLESFTQSRSAALVRNEAWAFGKTKLDRVNIRLAADSGAQGRAAFASGDVDLAILGSGTDTAGAGQSLVKRSTPLTRMVIPLTRTGPLKSREARQAVSYALDREAISRTAQAFHEPAHGLVPAAVPGGFGKPGVCPSCDAPDSSKARELAGQAGVKPGTKVRLYFPDLVTYKSIAEAVSVQIKRALGWNVELRPTQFADLRKTLAADDASGLALSSWAPDYPTPYTLLWPLLGGTLGAGGEDASSNYNGWKNARFDTLIGEALRSTSADGRTSLYKEAEKIALDDLALIPLMTGQRAALVRGEKYVGLGLDYDGDPTLATAALK